MDKIASFVVGFLLSVFIVISAVKGELREGLEAARLIEECQKTLPRNQYCRIVAEPVVDDLEV